MENIEQCSVEKFAKLCHVRESESFEGCTFARGMMPGEWTSPRLQTHECLFFICLSGGMQAEIEGMTLSVPSGSLLVCPPSSTVRFVCRTECRFVCIIPSLGYLSEHYHYWKRVLPLLIAIRGKNVLLLTETEMQKMERMAGCVQECLVGNRTTLRSVWEKETLHSSIRMLLCVIFEKVRAATEHTKGTDVKIFRNRCDDYFARFMDLLCIYYKQERRVDFYAERLCITPKYLSSSVKKASGKTPCEWIDQAVMEDILHLLRNSQNSIKEIACSLHFDNISFFGKYVKRHTGFSPTQYRAAAFPSCASLTQ